MQIKLPIHSEKHYIELLKNLIITLKERNNSNNNNDDMLSLPLLHFQKCTKRAIKTKRD